MRFLAVGADARVGCRHVVEGCAHGVGDSRESFRRDKAVGAVERLRPHAGFVESDVDVAVAVGLRAEGEFHFVSVAPWGGRRDDRMRGEWRLLQVCGESQRVADLLLFPFALFGVVKILGAASTTQSEERAFGFLSVGRWRDNLQEFCFGVLWLAFGDERPDTVAGECSRDENDEFAVEASQSFAAECE